MCEALGLYYPCVLIILRHLKIIHIEMLNVVVALMVWPNNLARLAVKLLYGNLAVVQVFQTGKTRDSFVAACIHTILLILPTYDMNLQVHHVPGSRNNISDLLSRIYSDKPIGNSLFRHLKANYQWKRIPEHFLNLHLHL